MKTLDAMDEFLDSLMDDDEQLDNLAEKEYQEYLESIGAIREDGTIDRSKIKYDLAQTFEELEAPLRKNEITNPRQSIK